MSAAELMAPGYTLVNLVTSYALADRITVFGRINNLLNQQYQDPLGFMRPCFGIFGGMAFQLGGESSSLPSSGAMTTALPSAGPGGSL
jgi:outer membrane receptor protein involved in Fe transport